MSMEEKRKKFGMEMLPRLHKQLKQFALEHDMKLYQATERAIEGLLGGVASAGPASLAPAQTKWNEKLSAILNSGHRIAIDAVTENLIAFERLVKVDQQAQPDSAEAAAPFKGRKKTA